MGLNISPAIWQSYTNAILDCLQGRKYCEVIMYDLLLFTLSKNNTFGKTRKLTESIMEKGTEDILEEVSTFQDRITVYGS